MKNLQIITWGCTSAVKLIAAISALSYFSEAPVVGVTGIAAATIFFFEQRKTFKQLL